MYMIKGFFKHAEQDDFKNGCLPNTGHSSSLDIDIIADTKSELIEKVKSWFDVTSDNIELNACDELGRIDIQVMENGIGDKATDTEISMWKEGCFNLWLANYSGQLVTINDTEF